MKMFMLFHIILQIKFSLIYNDSPLLSQLQALTSLNNEQEKKYVLVWKMKSLKEKFPFNKGYSESLG